MLPTLACLIVLLPLGIVVVAVWDRWRTWRAKGA